MQDMEKLEQECTHNCASCSSGCGSEDNQGVGLFERAITALSDIESDDLLQAITSLGQDEEQ